MTHFQSKTHLLMWLEKNCPRKAIIRALQEGQVELLGGFSTIPPTSHPGWIVKVTSTHGKESIVAVIAYQNRYGIRVLSEVPWLQWHAPVPYDRWNPRNPLYDGDAPQTYWDHRLMAEQELIDEAVK